MNTQKIAVDKMFPNTWNPNVVAEKTQTQLMEDIKRDGFTQPIIVRKHPDGSEGNYEIIDGEHRWNAVKALGWKEVDCLVEEKTDAEAMIRTITMNKLRGEFDSLKLAEVLVALKKTYSEEELINLLGYTDEELKSYEELLDFDPNSLDDLGTGDADLPPEITSAADGSEILMNTKEFEFNLLQLDVIETAIEMAGGSVGKPDEQALTEICDAFLKNNYSEAYNDVKERAEKLTEIQNNPNPSEVEPPIVKETIKE